MSYTDQYLAIDSGWNGIIPETPTSTRGDKIYLDDPIVALQWTGVGSRSRNLVTFSIQISFWLGAILVLGMIGSFVFYDIWVGLMFIPPLLGAYGLFLSSGKQLPTEELNYRVDFSWTETK